MTYNNKDSKVITKQAEKGIIITYVDYNQFKKYVYALKMYLKRTYKDLTFNIVNELKQNKKPDGDYEIELFTEERFKKVYGAIKLKYYVQNNVVVIKEITPGEILMNLHSVLAETYKGVPYTNEKELFRIKMILGG